MKDATFESIRKETFGNLENDHTSTLVQNFFLRSEFGPLVNSHKGNWPFPSHSISKTNKFADLTKKNFEIGLQQPNGENVSSVYLSKENSKNLIGIGNLDKINVRIIRKPELRKV